MLQKVGVGTTQNVLIDYEVAGLGSRIGAFLLDLIVIIGIMLVLGLIGDALELGLAWMIILQLPAILYHPICETLFQGQSLGKRQLNLKVVKLDGTTPTIGGYLLRWLLQPIDFGLYGSVAILSYLLSARGQRLGDMVAGTTVVKHVRSLSALQEQMYQTPDQPEGYAVQFPQVSRLSENDINLIRETLRTYRLSGNAEPVAALHEKAQEMLGVQTDLPPVKFLNVIIEDYTYLSAKD